MNITLENLLSLYSSTENALHTKRIKLVRHAMVGESWLGFNKILRFNKDVLAAFTAVQRNDIFKKFDLIMTFVPYAGSKALFAGAFWNEGACHSTVVTKTEGYKQYDSFRKTKNNLPVIDRDDLHYSKLTSCDDLTELNDRLVIDWGGAARSWHQNKLDKKIHQILPSGFVSEFPGWDKVFLTHQEMCAILGSKRFPDGKNGNPSWNSFLSSHDGVYLITDTNTGQQYVGSAYGENGILGRWEGYIGSGHNGNDRLKKLIKKEGMDYCRHFAYSLHNVFPKGSITIPALIQVESLFKEKLGSRAFGLNAN